MWGRGGLSYLAEGEDRNQGDLSRVGTIFNTEKKEGGEGGVRRWFSGLIPRLLMSPEK